MTHVLLLGGTSDASALAHALHQAGIRAVFSYAGVTRSPQEQPLPTRKGGFGGVQGLMDFMRSQRISHVVDATHPFAAQMSSHACAACAAMGVRLLALERAAWRACPGDHWLHVPDMASAARALPEVPSRVFLSVGRQQLHAFASRPQHHYLLRLVDPPMPGGLPLRADHVVVARGPFSVQQELALLQQHRIDWLVTKNAGGLATRGKLDAARLLHLPVVMVQRPVLPERLCTPNVQDVLYWLRHDGLPSASPQERGV